MKYLLTYLSIIALNLTLSISAVESRTTPPEAIYEVLAAGLPHLSINDITVKELKGGLSGAFLYKIESPDKSYVLRFYSQLNQQDSLEIYTLIEAAKKGLSPSIQYVSSDNRAVLMEFIDLPTVTLWQAKQPDNIVCMSDTIRQAHIISDVPNEGEGLLSKAIRCHQVVSKDGLAPREEIDNALQIVKESEKELSTYNYAKVNVHGDLNPRNIFIGPNQIYLIDWAETISEDPFYDLSYFSLKLDYNADQEILLISSYLLRKPTQKEINRFNLHKKIHQAFWSLTNLYLAKVEMEKFPEQAIEKTLRLKEWGHYQKLFADGLEPLTAQYFYELSRLNYKLANN